jgi:chromosome segregation ATPase
MRSLLIALTAAALVGCVQKAPTTPASVPLPAKAKTADTKPVEAGVDRTQARLQQARRSADALTYQLRKAQAEARTASERATEAYTDGVVAGSVEADQLKQAVEQVEASLADTETERDKLTVELTETENELKVVRSDLGIVRDDLSKMEAEAINLRAGLATANTRLGEAATAIDDLKTKTASLEAKLDGARKWMWRWFIAFAFLAALNAVYIAGRINGWGWIR